MCDLLKNRWVLALVLIVFVIAKIPYLSYAYYWDESWPYVPAIMEMHRHGVSLLPTAIDPNLSRGHPLFFHAIGALWTSLFGGSHTSLHSFALFISVLFLITIYEAAYRIFNKRVATIAILLVATDLFFFVQSTFVLFEMLVAFLSFLSIYLYARGRYLYATLSLTALFLTKESGMIAGFVIGIDGLISLFNKQEKIQVRLLKLMPVTVACAALGLFFLLQKHYNGWYVLPLYSETILNKWPDIWYRFRTASLRTIFYSGYECYIFLAMLVYTIVAVIKTRKANSLFLLLLAVPAVLTYYLVDDDRSANWAFGATVAAFISFIVFYSAALLSFASQKYYSDNVQRKLALLIGFFVLAYMLFSSVAYFIPRYELAGIIAGLFLVAVFFDTLIRHSFSFLYYPLLVIIAVVAFFTFRDNKGWTDADLGFKYGVKTQQALVEFMEWSNFYDKHIASSSFLEREHLTDRNTGFLANERAFTHVTSTVDSTTELVVFDDIEFDPIYNDILRDPSFELIYHIEMHGVWADVFRRKRKGSNKTAKRKSVP